MPLRTGQSCILNETASIDSEFPNSCEFCNGREALCNEPRSEEYQKIDITSPESRRARNRDGNDEMLRNGPKWSELVRNGPNCGGFGTIGALSEAKFKRDRETMSWKVMRNAESALKSAGLRMATIGLVFLAPISSIELINRTHQSNSSLTLREAMPFFVP
jgi:hypothetical protein